MDQSEGAIAVVASLRRSGTVIARLSTPPRPGKKGTRRPAAPAAVDFPAAVR
jgi:hypothetical protein